MDSKGQADDAFKYFIIVMILIAIILAGFFTINKIQNKLCEASIAKFEIELQELGQSVKPGSSQEKILNVPCGIDKVYFFDLADEIDDLVLRDIPLMRDSVKSKAQKNVFLVKENKLLDTLYAGNLMLDYPGYICMIPRSESIDFFVDGESNGVSIVPACLQQECSFIPVEQDNQDAANIFTDAKNFGKTEACINCPRQATSEFAKFIQTRENIILSRKYQYCKETGITNIEIKVVPKDKSSLRDLVLYEYIPKECIDDLRTYLASELDSGKVSINSDPMIMWRLDDLEGEQVISYAIKKSLSDECKKLITVVGSGIVERGIMNVPVPEMPIIDAPVEPGQNTPPEFSLPSTYEISGLEGSSHLVFPRLSKFVRDKEQGKSGIGFSIVSQANQNIVSCAIQKNEQMVCTIKINDYGYSDLILEAFDGENEVKSRFRLRVKPFIMPITCGDRVCSSTETCTSCPGDCGGCLIDEAEMYLKCGYSPQTFCKNAINCPQGTEWFGGYSDCECGFTCKKQYTCYAVEYTDECATATECPNNGVEMSQIPCIS